LGPIGTVRVVQAQIWLMRLSGRWTPAMIWVLWISAASALTIVCVLVPPLAWPSGLVLGGSLSHAVEISRRGLVCDYVCLRLWPAFDLADLALTLGVAGILVELLAVLPRPWG
jgi:lipoprotein signal peptidase